MGVEFGVVEDRGVVPQPIVIALEGIVPGEGRREKEEEGMGRVGRRGGIGMMAVLKCFLMGNFCIKRGTKRRLGTLEYVDLKKPR